jgi:hypothetical protein
VDGFCLDGDARFQLPDPDPDNNGITSYSVWVRAVGKPNGGASLRTCFQDVNGGGATWCSTESAVAWRDSGKPHWDNVTKELLTICVNNDADPACDLRVFLFDDLGDLYWWNYDNYGNRIVQLRFYPVPTNVGLGP